MGAANATDPAENPARAVLACSKPIVGAINGVAITGGFEVALACDVLICSTNARFADTHARVGITPGWGLSQKLSRAIGALPRQGAVADRQLPDAPSRPTTGAW